MSDAAPQTPASPTGSRKRKPDDRRVEMDEPEWAALGEAARKRRRVSIDEYTAGVPSSPVYVVVRGCEYAVYAVEKNEDGSRRRRPRRMSTCADLPTTLAVIRKRALVPPGSLLSITRQSRGERDWCELASTASEQPPIRLVARQVVPLRSSAEKDPLEKSR